MKRVLIAIVLGLLSACAGRIPDNYSAPDAGFLVLALGTSPSNIFTSYNLYIQSKDKTLNSGVFFNEGNILTLPLLVTPRDFETADGNGAIFVKSLPAGDYEIYNFQASANRGVVMNYFRSRNDFSIPFTVRPGRGTYVGEFKAFPISGQNIFGIVVDAGVFFLVTDRSDRDISIAKSKMPRIPNIDIAVPDVEQLGNPLVRAGHN